MFPGGERVGNKRLLWGVEEAEVGGSAIDADVGNPFTGMMPADALVPRCIG
jgi:hypothetical protein